MMNEELKPCPFCGDSIHLKNMPWIDGTPGIEIFHNDIDHATKAKCPLVMVCYKNEEDAAKAWNTRYEPTSTCENCGQEYKPTSPEQKYCCKSCKEIAHIKRSDPETATILARIYGVVKADA